MKVPRPIRLVDVGSVLLLMLLLVVVGYLLALHFYRTRADFRGKSDDKDLEIFPRSHHPQRTSQLPLR